MTPALTLMFDDAIARLLSGAADRKSPFHTPAVATADGDARIMVLRAADGGTGSLRFHTDRRSPKLAGLAGGKAATALFYDAAAAVQLRVRGTLALLEDVAETDRIWRSASAYARRCYIVEHAPGTPLEHPGSGLPAWAEGVRPTEEQLIPGRNNFAVLRLAAETLDYLSLAHDGHRRARFTRTAEGDWHGEWVVP